MFSKNPPKDETADIRKDLQARLAKLPAGERANFVRLHFSEDLVEVDWKAAHKAIVEHQGC